MSQVYALINTYIMTYHIMISQIPITQFVRFSLYHQNGKKKLQKEQIYLCQV